MNELSLKLKTEVIRLLTKNDHNLDDLYIMRGDISYTRRELAIEITNESDLGIKMLADMIMLAIDITARHNKKPTPITSSKKSANTMKVKCNKDLFHGNGNCVFKNGDFYDVIEQDETRLLLRNALGERHSIVEWKKYFVIN